MIKTQYSKTIKGVLWSAIERFSVQAIQFILSIILARLVMPSEYGLIAMLSIFTAIAQCFIDSGFGNALIQKQNRNEKDYSTVFYFNIVIAVILYITLYNLSPIIASFYNEPKLEIITKITGLNLLISSFSIVQYARLTINMDFKNLAKGSLLSVILGGIVGIYLAYKNFGVWALVVQGLITNILNTVYLWICTGWKPMLSFSYLSFKQLFSFGSKLLLSSFLHVVYINLYSLVIGKKYSATDVGLYNRAFSLAQFPSSNIVSIITRVSYPAQCKIQNENKELAIVFHQYLQMSCYIIFPLMVGLAVLAKPLILFLLGKNWEQAADILSILCIAYMWYPIMVLNNQILNVKGRTDYFLKAELIKKMIALIILISTLPFGLTPLCLGVLIYNIIDMSIIIYYSKKVILTSYLIQIKKIAPHFLLAISMGLSVACISLNLTNLFLKLMLGTIGGILHYIILSHIFHFKELKFIFSILKR